MRRWCATNATAVDTDAWVGGVVGTLPQGYAVIDIEFITGLHDEGFVRVGLHCIAVHDFGRADLTEIENLSQADVHAPADMAATAHTDADIDWAAASLGILLNGLLLRNFAEAGARIRSRGFGITVRCCAGYERQADEADAENLCEACVHVVLQWAECGVSVRCV